MSQPLVSSYFPTRKRRPSEELLNKSKVLIVNDDDKRKTLDIFPEEKTIQEEQQITTKCQAKKDLVSRNLQFDLSSKQSRPKRIPKSRKFSIDESQQNIITTFQKAQEKEESKRVEFKKLGCLSPKKTPTKSSKEQEIKQNTVIELSTEPSYMKTPTKSSPFKDMSLEEIKKKISGSSRLAEIRKRIDSLKKLDDKLDDLQKQKQELYESKKKDVVKIKEFDRIHLEIPISPLKSPNKFLTPNKYLSPTKTLTLSPKASPARRALFEPKEPSITPVTASPTKTPAYQKYWSLGDALKLPYHYRLLLQIFTSIDAVAAMLHNRKEIITFSKLKPAVQTHTGKNFTLSLLAQIKSIYPEAFTIRQQKMRAFSSAKREEYELVLSPVIEVDSKKSGRNTPDEENVLKSAQETLMPPSLLVERRKKFEEKILNIVRDEHEKFLLSLDPPVTVSKEKVTRWHPEFDVETCRDIEEAELPKPPTIEKVHSAKEVLEMAHNTFTARMQKAMEKLAKSKSKVSGTDLSRTPEAARNINSSIVDTPPATPKSHHTPYTNPELKGIPLALLEKVRAKQAATALKMMTRSKDEDKDLLRHSRLPDIAKILRNIFVSEKKSVLLLETVIKKLDDSYRIKLSTAELEDHIRLICQHLPSWANIHEVRKMNYLKLAKDLDMTKVINKLQEKADEKL